MNISFNGKGFIIEKDSVEFVFTTKLKPVKNGSRFDVSVVGEVPVPILNDNDRLLLPVDEGLALTVADNHSSYDVPFDSMGGNFCSRDGTMNMVIIERQGKFLLISLESGLHSNYCAKKENGRYNLYVNCNKECLVSYSVFDSLRDACKYYRSTIKENLLTLDQKIKENAEITKLCEGGIFWVWSDNYNKVMYSETNTDVSAVVGDKLIEVADELHTLGVDNAMFGLFFDGDSPSSEQLYKKHGYLSTQYDNYNDVLNPELLKIVPSNRARNCDYTARRMKDYPDGVRILKDGRLAPAWELKGFDGKFHPQNTLCPLIAAQRIKEEVPEILKKYPYYKGRFLDVYGTSLSDCYSDKHPVTVEECLEIKNGAFNSLKEMGLIVGTEEGFEGIINSIIYSEGIHSPVYLRNADSGRRQAYIYNETETEKVKTTMLNPELRVPLWQLVYHENLIVFPYWGDSTESCPEVVNDRILFACLYGCPPIYSFLASNFEKLKDEIILSYKRITAVLKKTATLPMTDFEILTPDYKIQKSVFGEKYTVTVNFSDEPYTIDGKTISPKDYLFEEA